MKVFYQRWVFGKLQDVETSIEVLDISNKTNYSNEKIKDLSLLESAAKNAHDNGLIYYLTIYNDEDNPYCQMEINKDFFRVRFFDGNLRIYMSYDFYGKIYSDTYGDRLFLAKITFWEFNGSSNKALKNEDHLFKVDGTYVISKDDLKINERTISYAKNKIDVSKNWEDYPAFGMYHSLIRKERE